VICGTCGHIASAPNRTNNSVDEKLDQSTMKLVIGISITILVVFMQLGSWGSHAAEIRWVQLRDLVGMNSMQSLNRMAEICQELKKMNCVEYAYKRQAQLDKKQTSRLAEFLISRNKFKDAANALGLYLKTAKQDSKAMLLYARALSEDGQIDKAIHYYERMMTTQMRVLQPELIQNYVRDLSRAKRYTQAQAVILRTRRMNARAAHFMEQEFRILGELSAVRQTASVKQ
jgi:hypothetical protein